MPYNGSGVFNRIYSWINDRDNGIKILAARVDAECDGFATGLSNCLTKDGQTTATANLAMGGYRHTGVGNATSRDNYISAGQVQDGSVIWGGTAGGTANAITITTSPVTTTYAAGQGFWFLSSAANTGATTINVNSLGARDITKNGGNALGAGDIPSGALVGVKYDGTRFQIINVNTSLFALASALAGYLPLTGGTLTGVLNTAQGSDIASASTINLDTATGNIVDVTGSVGINAVTLSQGRFRIVRFTGALTLTHGANLVLPTGANITTAAGDYAIFAGYASSVVRCVGYFRANGQPLAGGSATQAEMESASSTVVYVTPGRLQFHPSAAKVWCDLNGTGTAAIRASYGMSSITDDGVGKYTFSFGTAFSSANYAVAACCESDAVSINVRAPLVRNGTKLAGSVGIEIVNNAGNAFTDSPSIGIAIFGDL